MTRKLFLLIAHLLVFFHVAFCQTLEERLKSLPDIISVKKMNNNSFFQEAFKILVKQPVNHQDTTKGFFPQRIFLSHLSYNRPVVFITEGYGGNYADTDKYVNELCPILDANQLFAEHRFFGESKPDSVDWKQLTVENAAADHHHIVQIFKKLYAQKWVSTGISKGGQTVMYHRMLYPDDVAVSVPYVGPLNFSYEDQRHQKFIGKKVGTKADRAKVFDFQSEVLKRKARLMPLLEQLCKEKNFQFRAPLSEIYDYSVLEYAFSFWQWGHSVSEIPAATATDQELFDYWQKISSVDYFDMESGKSVAPFFIQAHSQLGYYAYNPKPFGKDIDTRDTRGYIEKLFLPKELVFKYNPEMSLRTDHFIRNEAKNILMIYGEWDPWIASAAQPGKNKNMIKIVQPGGNHRTRINTLPENQKEFVVSTLKKWME
jgi:hypothetical protein